MKAAHGFFQTPHLFPHHPLYILLITVINLSHEYHYMVSPMRPPSNSPNTEEVLRIPNTDMMNIY